MQKTGAYNCVWRIYMWEQYDNHIAKTGLKGFTWKFCVLTRAHSEKED